MDVENKIKSIPWERAEQFLGLDEFFSVASWEFLKNFVLVFITLIRGFVQLFVFGRNVKSFKNIFEAILFLNHLLLSSLKNLLINVCILLYFDSVKFLFGEKNWGIPLLLWAILLAALETSNIGDLHFLSNLFVSSIKSGDRLSGLLLVILNGVYLYINN